MGKNTATQNAILPVADATVAGTLAPWQLSVIDLFVRGAAMIGLRKSVGMVYGMLYCSREPLCVPEMQTLLQLSRGAVVEATQLLRHFGAVRVVLKIGERKDFFAAETDLKKFLSGAVKEILVPALEKADMRLKEAEQGVPAASGTESDFSRSRLAELNHWKSVLVSLLPLAENLLNEKNDPRISQITRIFRDAFPLRN